MLQPRHVVPFIFLACALYAHLRGRIRFGLLRALTDFTVLLAPLNALLFATSKLPARPFIETTEFPELGVLQQHWQVIRDEALRLQEGGSIRAAAGYNDLGFNSFFRTGWKRFYVKWYGEDLPSAQALCPETVRLLAGIPSLKAAMFASLPPGSRLVRHRDPYAGSLRYHLGLATPNSEACYIDVDGQRYHWRDGEAVIFDETFIHYAENTTGSQRIILFCDVERPLRSRLVTRLNRWFARVVMKASSTQNVEGEPIGALNRVFGTVYQARLWGKALKRRSRVAYYTLKWAALLAVAYAVVV